MPARAFCSILIRSQRPASRAGTVHIRSSLCPDFRHPGDSMIKRSLFNAEHEAFRDAFARFMAKEIAPHHEAWEEQGYVDREVWRLAGRHGFLCMSMPEAYGGAGADKLYAVVQMEELARAGFTGIGYGLHSEIVAPYLLHYGTEAQKKKYLPLLASGEMVGAIAMSEPAAGSDLAGIRSTAMLSTDGSHYLVLICKGVSLAVLCPLIWPCGGPLYNEINNCKATSTGLVARHSQDVDFEYLASCSVG